MDSKKTKDLSRATVTFILGSSGIAISTGTLIVFAIISGLVIIGLTLYSATIDRIRDFETVLNGYYPTASDIRLNSVKRKLMKTIAGIRYKMNFYKFPYEIKLLQRVWKYRQPEIQGF